MKIVITDWQTITDGDIDVKIFDKFGKVTCYQMTPYELIADRIKDADAVICNKTILNADTMRYSSHLKYIGLFATGYNNIDIEYAHECGITVCNAGSYSTDAVAQHTFAFILNHFNNVSGYDAFVKNSGWINSETFSPFVFPLSELAGKTIGIVGCGSIGLKVARIADAFGMNVLAYSRSAAEKMRLGNNIVQKAEPPSHMDNGVSYIKWVELDELYAESDVITVHCPLNRESEKMFDAKAFGKFKKGAYFINTARGGVLNERALYDALEKGRLSGAAIDVLETEPMDRDCILMKAKNITFTPHVAWAPIETRKRLMGIVISNIKSFLDGNPVNVV